MNQIALFIISTENEINLDKDTSYVLMLEAQRRGFSILICDHRSVNLHNDNKTVFSKKAHVVEVLEKDFVKESVFVNSKWGIKSQIKIKSDKDYYILENFNLTDADLIFMRSDPPVDDEYLQCCSCLEKIQDEVLIINKPTSLFTNEKLCTLKWPELIPKTFLIDKPNQSILEEYIEIFPTGIVVKPLNLCGGEGVQMYNGRNFDSLNLDDSQYIIQEFIKEVYEGDKRIIMLNGEPLGAILRVAKEGSFICNFHAGGSPYPTEINKDDINICNKIKSFLIESGIYFAGIDIIGGKLTEINITSPTCVQEINRANNVKLEKNVLDFIVEKLKTW